MLSLTVFLGIIAFEPVFDALKRCLGITDGPSDIDPRSVIELMSELISVSMPAN